MYFYLKKLTPTYLFFAGFFLLFISCQTDANKESQATTDSGFDSPEWSADDDVSATTFIFKNQLCYAYSDELGNQGEYDIMYQPASGMLFVAVSQSIPMIDGILIFPDGTYQILGQDESGKRVRTTYKHDRDLVVPLKDEPGVTYPKDHPYTTYLKQKEKALIYRDGNKASDEFISSTKYAITFERSQTFLNLHLTDAYPQLNARLLYGLARLPGDVGEFFKPYGELWNISSAQWPTLISGENYAEEMTCFGATDYHVDPELYADL